MLDNIFSKIWKSKNHSVNVTKVINNRGLIFFFKRWERKTRLNEWLKYRFINKRISWEEKHMQYIQCNIVFQPMVIQVEFKLSVWVLLLSIKRFKWYYV